MQLGFGDVLVIVGSEEDVLQVQLCPTVCVEHSKWHSKLSMTVFAIHMTPFLDSRCSALQVYGAKVLKFVRNGQLICEQITMK